MTTLATAKPDTAVPEPGIYYDVDFATYLSWDCANNSRLSAAQLSALHLCDAFERDAEPATESMRLGSFMHSGKLEPMSLLQRYVVMPEFEKQVCKPDGSAYDSPKSTKAYKQLVAEFTAANTDKEIVTQDHYERMMGMVTAMSRDERTADYLSPPGRAEVSIVWDDEETGIRCKVRIDWLALERGYFVDLKSTRCAHPAKFMFAIEQYGYDQQLAMYREGIHAATGESLDARLVVVENTRPFGVISAPLSSGTMYRGDFYFRRALRMLAHGRDTGEWPGYEPVDELSVRDGAIPDGTVEDITLNGKAITL